MTTWCTARKSTHTDVRLLKEHCRPCPLRLYCGRGFGRRAPLLYILDGQMENLMIVPYDYMTIHQTFIAEPWPTCWHQASGLCENEFLYFCFMSSDFGHFNRLSIYKNDHSGLRFDRLRRCSKVYVTQQKWIDFAKYHRNCLISLRPTQAASSISEMTVNDMPLPPFTWLRIAV